MDEGVGGGAAMATAFEKHLSLETGESNDVVEEMTNLVRDNMNDKIVQELMDVTLNDVVPIPPSRNLKKLSYRFAFVSDEKAGIADEMERNHMAPWNIFRSSDNEVLLVDQVGAFMMSPEYLGDNYGEKDDEVNKSFKKTYYRREKGERVPIEIRPMRQIETKKPRRLGMIISKELKKKLKRKDRETRKFQTVLKKPNRIVNQSDITDIESTVVAKCKDVGHFVTLRSIKRLGPLQELDDALVDFGIYDALDLQQRSDVVYVPGYSWPGYFFTDDDPIKEFKRQTFYQLVTNKGKDPNLSNKKFMLIPVCREAHWFLVIICNPLPSEELVRWAVDKINSGVDPGRISKMLYSNWTNHHINNNSVPIPMIFVLDSKYQAVKRSVTNWSEFHDSTVGFILKGLRYLHQTHWEHSGTGITVDEETFTWKHGFYPWNGEIALQYNSIPHFSLDVPEQRNGKDCGLFVITFVKTWFQTMQELQGNYSALVGLNLSNWFDPGEMTTLRRQMFQKILENCKQYHPNAVELVVQSNPFPSSTEQIKAEAEPDTEETKI